MELTATNIFSGEIKALCERKDSLFLKTIDYLNNHKKDYVHLVVTVKGQDKSLIQDVLTSKYYDPCKMSITFLSADAEEVLGVRLLDRFAKHCDLVFVDSTSVMTIDFLKVLKPYRHQYRQVKVFPF